LLFPPDPGAAEQSQLGGNIACNAGGPHAFKYGVTRAWVLGLEVVVPPGEVIHTGGPVRKDVSGYDLTGLMVGSEGTLGIVTAAWLRLVPAPEVALPVAAAFASAEDGCAAIAGVMADGIQAAALEYLDGEALRAAGGAFPVALPHGAGFLVIAEADGDRASAAAVRAALTDTLGARALALHAPEARGDVEALWRWRDGVSIAVTAAEGGKVSEDIAVPAERLPEAIAATREIGARHGLRTCSWGHAGDGNLHSTFMLDRTDPDALARAREAAEELFALAVRLGGTLSGEHGIGLVKRDALAAQLGETQLGLMRGVKHAFDPKGLLNPAKKLPPA
jgi:FAD/FMN-containing dehydrogenase